MNWSDIFQTIKMEFFISVFFILIFSSLSPAKARFDHVVSPSCASDKQVCEFNFEVSYRTTMISYQTGEKWAVPVVFNNGTFYKKEQYFCDNNVPISQKGMSE